MSVDILRSLLLGSPRRSASIWLVTGFFVLVVLVSTPHSDYFRSKVDLFEPYRSAMSFRCNAVINCVRIGTAAIGYAVDGVVYGLDSVFSAPDRLYSGPPYEKPFDLEKIFRGEEKQANLIFLSKFLYRVVVLSLLPVFVILCVPRTIYSLLLLLLSGLCMTGYGVLQPFFAEDLFFAFRSDQKGFWEFRRMAEPMYFDLFAVGFLAWLAVVMISDRVRNLRVAAGTAAVGQLSYEHLGLVTGIALALYMFITWSGAWRERLWNSARVLFACGIASACVALILVGILYVKHDGNVLFVWIYGFDEIFSEASPNLENYRYILFRMGYFLLVPVALGAVIGSACAVLDPAVRKISDEGGRVITAIICVLVGFFCAAAVGFFTATNMVSEMGRELLSAAIFGLFFGYFGSAWSVGGLARRLAVARTGAGRG